MSIRRIVVGIDDSPGSAAAVAWSADIAADLGAAVQCVHAFEPLDHLGDIGPGTSFAAVRARLEQQARDEWSRPLTDRGVRFDVTVDDGSPADLIVDTARAMDADLIVVGGRRMGLIAELALGSTSRRVVHEARRPVVIIHPPDA